MRKAQLAGYSLVALLFLGGAANIAFNPVKIPVVIALLGGLILAATVAALSKAGMLALIVPIGIVLVIVVFVAFSFLSLRNGWSDAGCVGSCEPPAYVHVVLAALLGVVGGVSLTMVVVSVTRGRSRSGPPGSRSQH